MNDTRTYVFTISPEVARQLRTECHFERQRKLDEHNIARLAKAMKRGTFIPGTQVYFGVLPDSKQLILNGNHTLEAVAESGIPQQLTFTYQPVESVDQAAAIYASFDNQKTRSWAERMNALNAKQYVKNPLRIGPAFTFIKDGFVRLRGMADTAERIALIEEHAEAAQLVEDCFSGASRVNQRLLYRVPVLAIALYTAEFQKTEAVKFWTSAATEDQPLKHPTRTLVKYLHNNKCKATTHWEILLATALAWNAAYEGRKLEYCKPNNCTELRIAGTPWHRGEPK